MTRRMGKDLHFVRTVLASFSPVIQQITRTTSVEEVLHILAASLTARRSERIILVRGADHRQILQLSHDHPSDQAGERVQLIQPSSPEPRYGVLRDRDTTEQREHHDDKRVQQR